MVSNNRLHGAAQKIIRNLRTRALEIKCSLIQPFLLIKRGSIGEAVFLLLPKLIVLRNAFFPGRISVKYSRVK